MREFKIYAPTYYGDVDKTERGSKQEFDGPRVPVVIRPADGIRIVLGTHDYLDCNAPDIQIERRPNGWAVFLHPAGGGDACGYVYFIDNGRSFLVPEFDVGTTHVIKVLLAGDIVPEVDNLNP